MKKLQLLFLAAMLISGAVFQSYAQKTPAKKPAPKSTPVSDVYGRMENGVYINDVFRFSLRPPLNWHILEADAMNLALEGGKENLKGDNARYNKLLEENFKAEKLLKSFLKKPVGAPENAFLGVSSQKISPEASSLEANMEVTRRSIMASKMAPIVSAPKRISFGLVKAMWMDTFIDQGDGIVLKQRLYVCPHKGYYINVAFTYFNAADLPQLEAAIKTLKFK